MIYKTKERSFYKKGKKFLKINKTEHKLLISLSGNCVVSRKELEEYLGKRSVIRIISDFRKKTGLHIKTKIGSGYILKEELYFE